MHMTEEKLYSNNFTGISLIVYPTAIKGCEGIVFIHGIQMGGRAGGQWEKVCLGYISGTIKEVDTWQGHLLESVGVQVMV